MNFMLLNAGLGIGGVISALIIDTESVASFQRLYLVNGLTYLVYIVVLLTLPRGTGARPADDEADAVTEPGGASRRGRWCCATARCCGWSASRSWPSPSATPRWRPGWRRTPWTSPRCPPARWAGPTPPTPARSCSASWSPCASSSGGGAPRCSPLCRGVWSVSWVVMVSSDAVSGVARGRRDRRRASACSAPRETLWAPVAPAIVNDLAREDLRGRYNALQGMTWTVGSIVGPALAGMLIGHGLPAPLGRPAWSAAPPWPRCCSCGLRRHLTDAQDGLSTGSESRSGRRDRLRACAARTTDDRDQLPGPEGRHRPHRLLPGRGRRRGRRPRSAGEHVVSFYVHHEPTFERDEVRRHLTVVVLTPTRLILAHTDEHAGDDLLPEPYTSTSTEAISLSSVRSVVVTRMVTNPTKGPSLTGRGGPHHRLGRGQPDRPRARRVQRPGVRRRPRLHRGPGR